MNGEYVDAGMRAPLLKRIADETGGKFYRPGHTSTLVDDVAMSKNGVTVVNQMDLWDMPAVFLLLVLLVSAEWGYRRARGVAGPAGDSSSRASRWPLSRRPRA